MGIGAHCAGSHRLCMPWTDTTGAGTDKAAAAAVSVGNAVRVGSTWSRLFTGICLALCQGDMQRLYGKDADIVREFAYMNRKIQMSEPLEQVFYEFACNSGSEDIYHFAEILLHVKRSGGNLTEIIRTTTVKMQEKTEVLQEIETAVAAKRAEQRMMMILLPVILLFITLSSPEYTGALYKNLAGVLVMSACLCGYLVVFFWSEKIVQIPV